LDPAFGPVKDPADTWVTLYGENFNCPDSECKDLTVRFGDPSEHTIFVKATWISSTKVKCRIPKYTRPNVLPVELTLNGRDFTNDNKTYGFFDPFVIDAYPRLIHVNGTTNVTVKGLGFVDSGETKAKFANISDPIICEEGDCIKPAEFLDENHMLTPTFPQLKVLYRRSRYSVMWDAIYIEVSVYADRFTDNRIALYYYEEPEYLPGFDTETPMNVPDELIVRVNINPNDMDKIKLYA